MTIRLNKVTRDLNVGISTVVEFLQKKGFAVEANPNTKINEEQYALLVKEFSTDKNLRLESERFIQERQNKDRNKASVSIDGYEAETADKPKVEEIKTVVPEDARPKFKPVGKIDLDKLNRKPVVEKVEEKKVEEPVSVVKEEPKPQPPQQTSMRTKIRIQVQLFPPKQLLHIQKTSFFCLHHILCRNLKMCYGKLKALQRGLNGGIGNHRYFIRRTDIIHIFLVFLA